MEYYLQDVINRLEKYPHFDADWKLEVFINKRQFKWEINPCDDFPRLLADHFHRYAVEDSLSVEKSRDGWVQLDKLYLILAKPHVDRIRDELCILSKFLDELKIVREKGAIEKIEDNLGKIESCLKQKIPLAHRKKIGPLMEKEMNKSGLGPKGAKKRLIIRVDSILGEYTNLTRENRLAHIHKLLCHFGLEDDPDDVQAPERIKKTLSKERSELERNQIERARPLKEIFGDKAAEE